MGSNENFKQEFKKRCFRFSLSVLKTCELLREKRINWPIIDQLVRSATSIGANIVEGGNSTSKKNLLITFKLRLNQLQKPYIG